MIRRTTDYYPQNKIIRIASHTTRGINATFLNTSAWFTFMLLAWRSNYDWLLAYFLAREAAVRPSSAVPTRLGIAFCQFSIVFSSLSPVNDECISSSSSNSSSDHSASATKSREYLFIIDPAVRPSSTVPTRLGTALSHFSGLLFKLIQ